MSAALPLLIELLHQLSLARMWLLEPDALMRVKLNAVRRVQLLLCCCQLPADIGHQALAETTHHALSCLSDSTS
jgi:hypothetical protein